MSTFSPTDSQSDSLESLHSDLEAECLDGLWRIEKELLTAEPKGTGKPHVWRWETVEPLLHRAGNLVQPGGGGDRRVIRLVNPSLQAPAGATHTISTAFQYLLPGETAPAHRHTPAAIRFIISGGGACTEVQGRPIDMKTGDLILTPNWSWHAHRSHTDHPVTWLDAIDSPLVARLKAMFFQPASEMDPGYDFTEGAGGYSSTGGAPVIRSGAGPEATLPPGGAWPTVYRWSDIEPMLRDGGGVRSPYDGDILYYANPLTGSRNTLPTLGCAIQRLLPGEQTRPHRHVSSVVYYVVSGRGFSVVDGQEYSWAEGDVLSIPTWSTHSHGADPSEQAILFSLTDRPVMEALNLYREEDAALPG